MKTCILIVMIFCFACGLAEAATRWKFSKPPKKYSAEFIESLAVRCGATYNDSRLIAAIAMVESSGINKKPYLDKGGKRFGLFAFGVDRWEEMILTPRYGEAPTDCIWGKASVIRQVDIMLIAIRKYRQSAHGQWVSQYGPRNRPTDNDHQIRNYILRCHNGGPSFASNAYTMKVALALKRLDSSIVGVSGPVAERSK